MFRGERAAASARALCSAFRPLRGDAAAPRVLLTGFGPFPGADRNATEEIVRSFGLVRRERPIAHGRGAVALPSGRAVSVSLMVLPVVWDAAALLVATEMRVWRPTLVLMSGVASASQPLWIETETSNVRAPKADAMGLRPAAMRLGRVRSMRLRFDVAIDAARSACEREIAAAPSLGRALRGVEMAAARSQNAYVCNATADLVTAIRARERRGLLQSSAARTGIDARAARSSGEHAFLHWPRDLVGSDIDSAKRILLAIVDALLEL